MDALINMKVELDCDSLPNSALTARQKPVKRCIIPDHNTDILNKEFASQKDDF